MPNGEELERVDIGDIPDLPDEVYEKGWTREGVDYPSYKDFVATTEPDVWYDFYADFIIDGEYHTFFMRRAKAQDFIDSYETYIDEMKTKITDIGLDYKDELGYIPEAELQYIWRAIEPVEPVEGEEE